MSAIGGKADIGSRQGGIAIRMSAFGGKADVPAHPSACPLIAKSGHSTILVQVSE